MKINYSYCSNSYGKNKKISAKKSFKFSRKIANREKCYIHREGKTSNLQKKVKYKSDISVLYKKNKDSKQKIMNELYDREIVQDKIFKPRKINARTVETNLKDLIRVPQLLYSSNY